MSLYDLDKSIRKALDDYYENHPLDSLYPLWKETKERNVKQGVKYDEDKLRWDLVPESLEEVVHVYTEGAKKYADRNWEKGLQWSRIFGALMRHAWAWWFGSTRHERGMHHLGSVAWCALALMQYEQTHPELDDRPHGGENEDHQGDV